MTTMTVVKRDDGKLGGFGERDQRAYGRFKKMIDSLGEGEFFTINYWFPRNGPFHRKHMKMVTDLFNSQEHFEDEYGFRKYLEMGAGYCDWAPGIHGAPIAIPKSIAYPKLDDEGLAVVHEKIKAFIRSDRPQRFLWPHLKAEQRSEIVEGIIGGFEQ